MQILWAQAVAQRCSNCCDNVRASERERETEWKKCDSVYKQYSRRSKWWQNQRFQLNCVSGRLFVRIRLIDRVHSFSSLSPRFVSFLSAHNPFADFIHRTSVDMHDFPVYYNINIFYQFNSNFVNSNTTVLFSYVGISLEWVARFSLFCSPFTFHSFYLVDVFLCLSDSLCPRPAPAHMTFDLC